MSHSVMTFFAEDKDMSIRASMVGGLDEKMHISFGQRYAGEVNLFIYPEHVIQLMNVLANAIEVAGAAKEVGL